MTDEVGLLEHAEGIVPRYEHGYCVDDVARGLVVVCRERAPVSPDLVTLARRYLYFLARAQAPDGRCRNRLGYDRHWRDQPGVEDCWGRALWGFGTAAARGPTADVRDLSLACFDRSVGLASPWPHAMAFAALGAAEVLDRWPEHAGARALLLEAAAVIGRPMSPAWPWPTPRLSYANAAIAEALIVCGSRLGDDTTLQCGLQMLEWLLGVETRDSHLSVVPTCGWASGETRPGFDQQPIEVAALADACWRAANVTGRSQWLAGVELSVAWFLGDNDAKTPLIDERTGGGCDGLTPVGRSRNQGAESTLAMIAVMQHGRNQASAECAEAQRVGHQLAGERR